MVSNSDHKTQYFLQDEQSNDEDFNTKLKAGSGFIAPKTS